MLCLDATDGGHDPCMCAGVLGEGGGGGGITHANGDMEFP